jgi:hypothetical protein
MDIRCQRSSFVWIIQNKCPSIPINVNVRIVCAIIKSKTVSRPALLGTRNILQSYVITFLVGFLLGLLL